MKVIEEHPHKQMTVLCGLTQREGAVPRAINLIVAEQRSLPRSPDTFHLTSRIIWGSLFLNSPLL